MADIINAKCFGCGKIIRVPASLGGRNAKCPGCGHIFTIPKPADSTMEIIGDEQLPAVATEEIVEGEVLPAPDLPKEGPTAREEESAVRRGAGVKRSPGRREAGGRRPSASKKSSAPLVLGIVAFLVIAGIVIVVAAGRNSKKDDKRDAANKTETKQFSQDEIALTGRAREYVSAFNRGNHADILEFFADKNNSVRGDVSGLLEKGTRYEDVTWQDPSVRGDEGSITFKCKDGKTVSMKWKRSGDAWKLAEVPK